MCACYALMHRHYIFKFYNFTKYFIVLKPLIIIQYFLTVVSLLVYSLLL